MMLGTDPSALSIAIGPPFTSTSTVFGLAATTAAMSSSCTPARPISLLSKFSASVVWSLPTNNTATSAALAAATAAGIMLLSFAFPTGHGMFGNPGLVPYGKSQMLQPMAWVTLSPAALAACSGEWLSTRLLLPW